MNKHRRTLHRNLLLPIGILEETDETSTSTPTHPKTKQKVPPRKKSTAVTPTRDDMTVPPVDSDSDDELYSDTGGRPHYT